MIVKTYNQAIEYLETFIKPVVFEKISQKQARMRDPLDRMRKLLELLDNPQEKFKSILIGGTSGKGSTSYFISHILTTAGYKTGLTISPHLQKVNERVQINGVEISDKEFVKLLNEIVPAVEKMKRREILRFAQDDNYEIAGEPSYFEILIAMAFLHFVKEKIDIAVVEVGMGGVYDATNTLNPLISAITNVSLDHTDILGKTVEKIAREKIGIIKESDIDGYLPHVENDAQRAKSISSNLMQSSLSESWQRKLNKKSNLEILPTFSSFSNGQVSIFDKEDKKQLIVVTGVKQKSVIKIIEDKCEEVGAKLFRLGKDFNYKIKKESIEGTNFDLTINCGRSKKLNSIKLSMSGSYQVENASLAIKTVLELQKFGFKISEQNIRKALSTSFFPGRFEIINLNNKSNGRLTHISNDAQLILDGAHNPAKMKAFINSLKKIYPNNRKIFIVAFKDDKDAKGMLKMIMKAADVIIITEFHRTIEVKGHGGMKISNFKDLVQRTIGLWPKMSKNNEKVKIYYAKSSEEALEKAMEISCISHSEFISESQDGLKEIPKPPKRISHFMAAQVRDDIYDNKNSLIVVTGSLYLVGEIRNQIIER